MVFVCIFVNMPRVLKTQKKNSQGFGVTLPAPLAKQIDDEANRKGTTRKAVVIERLWESYRARPDESVNVGGA